jgi:MFS family permease
MTKVAHSGIVGGAIEDAAPVPHRRAITAACMMAQFMAAVEGTIVGAAAPTISGTLGDFGLFSWVFGAYLLAQAATTPIYGRLSDIHGRRRVFTLGASLFLVSSVACGLAWGMVPLILFRFLQGLGAGAVQPIAWTILGDVYNPAERARIQGWLAGIWACSALGGPLLGAFLVQHFHWSAIFLINLPVGIIAIALLRAFLPERRAAEGRPGIGIDWAGATLLVLAVACLMAVLVQGSDLAAGPRRALLAVGGLAAVTLVWQQAKAAAPILPHVIWHHRVLVLGNAGSLIIGMFIAVSSLFLPSFIQVAMGRSITFAGFAIGASGVGWTTGTVVGGRLMLRTSYRLTGILGGMITAFVCFLLTGLRPESAPGLALAGALFMGLGLGFVNTTFIVSVQTAVDWSLRGAVTGANMFLRVFGQALGAGLFGGVFNAWLAGAGPSAKDDVSRLLAPGGRAVLEPERITTLALAIGHAMHGIYWITFGLALAMLGLAMALPAALRPSAGTRGQA